MSETGTKCGLGFVSGETLVRVESNMGICAIQVRSSPLSSDYTYECRIHTCTCSDGTVAVASATGNDAF